MIEVRDVTKRFGTTVALDSVSFSLEKGQILGFLGPNGAGKSTAMKIITTYLAPDDGSVSVAGIDVLEQPIAVRGRIGYLPETVPLYPEMNVQEYLDFVGRARNLRGARLRERLDWCVTACGLASEYRKPIQELSKGFRQRTGLAQALIHDPEFLILDEPTSGLDPLQIIGIRDLIHSLAGEKTIIFSTHVLQEVPPVTDRVVVINEGRIIADGSIGDLAREAMGSDRLIVSIREKAATVEPALRDLPGLTELVSLPATDQSSRFELHGPFDGHLAAGVGRLARERGWELTELREAGFSLEDTFIALTRRGSPSPARQRATVQEVA
jgi:ABC-2 type transport system ATP-binding protein